MEMLNLEVVHQWGLTNVTTYQVFQKAHSPFVEFENLFIYNNIEHSIV